MRPLADIDLAPIEEELSAEALDALLRESAGGEVRRKTAFLRFSGQDASLEIDYSDLADLPSFFETRYREVFGYVPKDGLIEIVSLRVIASVDVEPDPIENFSSSASDAQGVEKSFLEITSVHLRDTLMPGEVLDGPVLVPDSFGTLFLESGWRGRSRGSAAAFCSKGFLLGGSS